MNTDLLLDAAGHYVTPLAAVDVAVMEANIRQMAALATRAGVKLRPHAKTHKSPAVGALQVAEGAVGLTVATLHEAEVFAASGIRDLVLAHPPVGAAKLARLEKLAGRTSRLAVSVDSVEIAAALPKSVEVLWEVDSGLHRIGTAPGERTAEAVRELVKEIGEDRFRGLLTHAGHSYAAGGEGGRRLVAAEERGSLYESALILRRAGIQVRELSVGSTPTASFAAELEGLTEIRPGTYVYGDANQATLGSQRLADCALGVVATVVSTPAPDRAVVDAGSKALSTDSRVAGLEGFGILPDHPDLLLWKLNEEHGFLRADSGQTGLKVGDTLVIIPCHACTTINLHASVLQVGSSGSGWDPVEARGWR